MTSSDGGVLPTRLIDVSRMSLRDLSRSGSQDVADTCAQLVEEVSAPSMVTLAGGNS